MTDGYVVVERDKITGDEIVFFEEDGWDLSKELAEIGAELKRFANKNDDRYEVFIRLGEIAKDG